MIGILVGVSMPFYSQIINKNNLQLSATLTATSLRGAQLRSQSGVNDSKWGVYIENTGITVFQGDSYSTRDVQYDEATEFTGIITASGLTEVVYTQVEGLPESVGILVLSSPEEGDLNMVVNAKGMIDY